MKSLSTTAFCVVLLTVFHVPPACAQTITNSPPDNAKTCFQCNGAGKSKCAVPSCAGGQMDCPSPCLKLSKGVWKKMNVAGHDPNELWQTFRGKTGTRSWTQAHVGEVVQMQNGEPENIGKCGVCQGTTKVTCTKCKGTGVTVCSICDGKKTVPASWSVFDNPKLKDRPSRFKLKDGRELVGRKVAVMGDRTRIRTETGDTDVKTADIVSEERQSSKP
jgi:hypothetical protein